MRPGKLRLMKRIKVLFLAGLSFVCYQYAFCANQADAKFFLSVSGRVVQKETNLGVANVRVEICNELHHEQSFNTLTDKNGNFEIIGNPKGDFNVIGIPSGSYSVSVMAIQKSCPDELVVDESLSTLKIEVAPNKSVHGISIYLRNGESVSGIILGPDGKTPLVNASVTLVPGTFGKNLNSKVDAEGRFSIVGINAKIEKRRFCLVVMSPGYKSNHTFDKIPKPPYYANNHKTIELNKGNRINDLAIIMGKGNISVKGKVVSSDNLPIPEAEVHISSISRLPSELADGYCMTDKNGNFGIIGFKNAVEIEIMVSHEKYKRGCMIKQKLIPGENRFVIKLGPQQGQISMANH